MNVPLVVPREQIVEERGACRPDMQRAGWAGRDADANGHVAGPVYHGRLVRLRSSASPTLAR